MIDVYNLANVKCSQLCTNNVNTSPKSQQIQLKMASLTVAL